MQIAVLFWVFIIGAIVFFRKPLSIYLGEMRYLIQKKINEQRELHLLREAERIEEAKKQIELVQLREAKRKEEKKILADEWKTDLDQKLFKHRFNLIQEKKRCTSYDAYGNEDSSWIDWGDCSLDPDVVTTELMDYNERIFTRGIGYFWRNVILEDPNDPTEFFRGWLAYKRLYRPQYPDGIEGSYSSNSDWLIFLAHQIIHVTVNVETGNEDVDNMSGLEYEQYCKDLFELNGWDVIETPKSGDQGVDLVGVVGDVRLCIQCKRYSKPVGNSAVQQVSAGKVHYNGTHAAVVTNAGFTSAARSLAESTEVILWSTQEFASFVNADGVDDDEGE